MTYSEVLSMTRTLGSRGWLWPALVVLAIVVALWLVWQSRSKIRSAELSPVPILGWPILLSGLVILVLARNQDIWFLEVASEIPVIAGCVLLLAGWNCLWILAFPISFLIFSAPAPGWMVDAATVPLKVLISDLVTQVLYSA